MSEPALKTETDPSSIDEVKEQLTLKGRERGFVTSEDLLEAVPVDDFTPEQIEEFLSAIPEFRLRPGTELEWVTTVARGPVAVPIEVL